MCIFDETKEFFAQLPFTMSIVVNHGTSNFHVALNSPSDEACFKLRSSSSSLDLSKVFISGLVLKTHNGAADPVSHKYLVLCSLVFWR